MSRQPDLGANRAQRVVWADNLRVLLIGGVIVVHAATAYVVDVDWYYEERTTSQLWSLLWAFPVFLGGVFGLGPLFFLAGWFSASSLSHRGPGSFVGSRLLRLGLPLLVFTFVIDPLTDYLGSRGEGGAASVSDYLTNRTGTGDTGPMWFVAVVLTFSLVYAGWRALRPTSTAHGELARPDILLAVTTIGLLSFAIWQKWPYGQDTFWNLSWPQWPQGAVLFALGVRAGEGGWLSILTLSRARLLGSYAAAGLVALAGVVTYAIVTDDPEGIITGLNVGTLIFAFLVGTVAVCGCLWLVGWLRRRWVGQSPLLVRAGRAAYATYMFHPPVLVALSLLAQPLPMPPELKFLLVAVLGVPTCFTVGYMLTHLPKVNRVL
jgi:glucan biosynthesis protein C